MEQSYSSLTRANVELLGMMLSQERPGQEDLPSLPCTRLSPIRTSQRKMPSSLDAAQWQPATPPREPSCHDMAFIADSTFDTTLHGANVLDDELMWSPMSDCDDVLTLSPVSTDSDALKSRGTSPTTATKERDIISVISCGLSTLCFGDSNADCYSPCTTAMVTAFGDSECSELPPSKVFLRQTWMQAAEGAAAYVQPLASKCPNVPDLYSTRRKLFPASSCIHNRLPEDMPHWH